MRTSTAGGDAPIGYVELVRDNRRFRLLWSGQIVSLLGDWFNLIASASLMALLTQSGTAVGGLFVVRMLAPFVVSPFAGVAADRYNRKWLLILADIIRGLTVLGFLFVRRPEDIWILYTLTAVQLGLSGVFFPAKNAILPDITTRAELGAANALSSATWSVMLAFGAALGGLVSGIWGIYPAFVIDAITFFVSGIIIARIPYECPPALDDADTTVRAALRQYVDGLRYLKDNADILFISLHKAANGLTVAGAFQVVQVAIAERVFVIGEGGGISLGLLYALVGVGTGIGPIAARRLTGDRTRALRIAIVAGYGVTAAGLLLASTLISFPTVLAGTLLRGVGTGIGWVFSTQLLLVLVPDRVRGRIFSTEFAMYTLMNASAAATGGWLLDTTFEISALLQLMAGLALVPGVLWLLWTLLGTHAEPASSESAEQLEPSSAGAHG